VSEKLFLISKRIYDESDYSVFILFPTLKNLGGTYLLSFFFFHPSIYFLLFLLLLSLFALLHLPYLPKYMVTPLHSFQCSEYTYGACLSLCMIIRQPFFRRLIRKKILVLYSINYFIWLSPFNFKIRKILWVMVCM